MQPNAYYHDLFEDYLKQKGLRQTKQRRVILDTVIQLGGHVDAETVTHHARLQDPTLGLATVYRALKMMTEADILVERHFSNDRARFEFVDEPGAHHDHLICIQCGHIVEFYNEKIEQLQEQITNNLGFSLKSHRMELWATCPRGETCEYRNQPSRQKV